MNFVDRITRVLSLPAAYRAFSQLVAKDHWKGYLTESASGSRQVRPPTPRV
jgi:hypothetical protein